MSIGPGHEGPKDRAEPAWTVIVLRLATRLRHSPIRPEPALVGQMRPDSAARSLDPHHVAPNSTQTQAVGATRAWAPAAPDDLGRSTMSGAQRHRRPARLAKRENTRTNAARTIAPAAVSARCPAFVLFARKPFPHWCRPM